MRASDILTAFILGGLIVAQFWRVWDANREYNEALEEYNELRRRCNE